MIRKLQNKTFKNLSDREYEIAFMIVSGKRTIDIANEIGIKTNTVSTIKKNIYTKLCITNAIDLYKFAIKEGICKSPKPPYK